MNTYDEAAVVMNHIGKLGFEAKDKITGFKGVIDSLNLDLYGCIQYSIKPTGMQKDGSLYDAYWFDVSRVDVIGKKPLMDAPKYSEGYVAEGKKGPAERHNRQG